MVACCALGWSLSVLDHSFVEEKWMLGLETRRCLGHLQDFSVVQWCSGNPKPSMYGCQQNTAIFGQAW